MNPHKTHYICITMLCTHTNWILWPLGCFLCFKVVKQYSHKPTDSASVCSRGLVRSAGFVLTHPVHPQLALVGAADAQTDACLS